MIQIRRLYDLMTAAAQSVAPVLIGKNENDIRLVYHFYFPLSDFHSFICLIV